MMLSLTNIARSKGDPKVISSGTSSLTSADRWARGLGWFSIGLGLVELFMPRRITRTLGMRGQETLVRAFGAREIASGVLTLSADKQVGLWSRVAGDGFDALALMSAMNRGNRRSRNAGTALAVVAGIALVDVLVAQAVQAEHSRRAGTQRRYADRSGYPKGLQQARGAAKQAAVNPSFNGRQAERATAH